MAIGINDIDQIDFDDPNEGVKKNQLQNKILGMI